MNLEHHIGETGTFEQTLRDYGIPGQLHEGLIAFIVTGRPTGSFLESVLSNDLKRAVAFADMDCQEALCRIVKWLYNEAPGTCWGSPERVAQWMEDRRRERMSA